MQNLDNDVGIILGALAFLAFALVALLLRARARRRAAFAELGDAGPAETDPVLEDTALPGAPSVRDQALVSGLGKTRNSFLSRLSALFERNSADDALFEELEELLLLADLGIGLSERLVAELKEANQREAFADMAAWKAHLAFLLTRILQESAQGTRGRDRLDFLRQGSTSAPHVVMFVGVNGVGKTTSIGKIAFGLAKGDDAPKIVLAAGDTYRAAAQSQLEIWAERADASIIKGAPGADPVSVIYQATEHAMAKGADIVLADTAGRLHTQSSLMEELQKASRALGKVCEGAPHEILLVLDATTGQNGLRQAKEFHAALGLTGVILTKLDGTAKGGIAIAIADALKLPIRLVGVGEKPEDLRAFDAGSFVEGILGPLETNDAPKP